MLRIAPLVRIVSICLAFGVAAVSCGVTAESSAPAAVITKSTGVEEEISAADVQEIIDGVRGSERFVTTLYQGTVPANFDTIVLSQLIQAVVMRDQAAGAGIEPTPEDFDAARADLQQQLEAIFAAEADPTAAANEVSQEIEGYLELLVESTAYGTKLDQFYREQAENELGDSAGVPCASHILVETQDEADALIAELEDGADFAALAREHSIDPGSGAQGGDLGCSDPTMYVPEFRDALINATEGEVTEPVESDFGFHIILVTGSDNSLAIEDYVNNKFIEAFAPISVDVDSRFGSWPQGGTQVTPPAN